MKRERLVVTGLMTGSLLWLFMYGCADDIAEPAKYTSPESIEYQSLSASAYREAVNSITQTQSKRIGVQNKAITNQIESRDADIKLMNERYLYVQNITAEGFLRP